LNKQGQDSYPQLMLYMYIDTNIICMSVTTSIHSTKLIYLGSYNTLNIGSPYKTYCRIYEANTKCTDNL